MQPFDPDQVRSSHGEDAPGPATSRSLGSLIVAVLYLAAGLAGLALALALPPGYATAVWPAAGVALAALLLSRGRLWPGIWIGALITNYFSNLAAGADWDSARAVVVAASIATGATLQALLAWRLVQRHLESDPALLRTPSIIALLSLGGPLACLVNATWGNATLVAAGLVDREALSYSFANWWVGDSIGVMVVTPLALIALARPRTSWNRRRLSVALPLILTMTAVVLLFGFASDQEQQRVRHEFTLKAQRVAERLNTSLQRYADAVAALQSRVRASQDPLGPVEFADFVNPLLQRMPGLHALSWNDWVRGERRESYVRDLLARGQQGFEITHRNARGELVRAGEREAHVVVALIEPRPANRSAIGFDIYSNSTRRATVDQVRDTGQAAVTGPIRLVQESGDEYGVLYMAPVYSALPVEPDLDARRAAFRGAAVGVFRMRELLNPPLTGEDLSHLSIELIDESGATAPTLLAGLRVDHQNRLTVLKRLLDPVASESLVRSERIRFGGRDWRLRISTDRLYAVLHRDWSAWGVLAGGLGLTGMLGTFLLVLSATTINHARRAVALDEANQALSREIQRRRSVEQALNQEKERAEVTLHSIGDGVITTSIDGRIEYMNPVAERMTGWSLDEAGGQFLARIFQAVDESTRRPAPAMLTGPSGDRACESRCESLLISRDGEEYAIKETVSPIHDHDGRVLGMVIVFTDVSESRRLAREAAHQAAHDPLTDLVNRREFERRLVRALDKHHQDGSRHVLCYIDLDHFKLVNDSAGHLAGDNLLKQVTRIIAEHVRERDTLARLGGDEFALLLNDCPVDKATVIADSLVAAIREYRFVWDERDYRIGASVGVVALQGQASIEEVMTQADLTCYQAKNAGRGRACVYQSERRDTARRPGNLLGAADIRNAIREERLSLYCEPVYRIDAGDGGPAGFRVETRMRDRDGLSIDPACFIPAASRFGVMQEIDRWALETCLRDFERFTDGDERTRLILPLSANSLADERLGDRIVAALARFRVTPARIEVEVDESSVVRNLSVVNGLIERLRRIDIGVRLGRFGEGLGSFDQLKSLSVSTVSIAPRLIARVRESATDRAVVQAICAVGDTLGVTTEASDVADRETLNLLRDIGIDEVRGRETGRAVRMARALASDFARGPSDTARRA